MRQNEHFRANKKKNTRCRIYLVGKEKAKALNISLSIRELSRAKKGKEISSICDKDNGHGENLFFWPLS